LLDRGAKALLEKETLSAAEILDSTLLRAGRFDRQILVDRGLFAASQPARPAG
jgi:ATP-dependent Zn protease